jgi:uncharacterized membrane protein YphA (DoxX/SURF4 family)
MSLDTIIAGVGLSKFAAVVLAHPIVHFIALLGLCAAYLQGGIDKLLDFPRAVAETRQSGLKPAVPITIATIVTELGGSALVLIGYYQWLGALSLAGFTLAATFIANRFWGLTPPERFAVKNSFFEHLGLVGGFLLVAFYDLSS